MAAQPHRTVERTCDVAVVGGSAAGLAAALQLARQRRAVIVVDDGTPRNAPAAHMHGYLGHDGAPPSALIARSRDEVRRYGGEILTGRALRVLRTADGSDGDHGDGDPGFRVELTGGHVLRARRVVAATGLVDVLPDIDGLAGRWGRDVLHCPFCHGFEVRDRRLVQIVTHTWNLHPTPLLRHLTDRLTVVVHDGTEVDEEALAPLTAAGAEVAVERVPVRRIVTGPDDDRLTGVELVDGRTLPADAVVVGPRFTVRAEPFAPAGLRAAPHPTGMGDVVEVDATGRTAVPGLYAAGNVTDPSMQVLHAAAHGSRVGATVAFDLAEEDLRAAADAAAARPSAHEADWDRRYGDDAPVWSGNPNGTLVREVEDLAPGRALDVGAGEGGDALWLAERGWRVTATDISARALARVAAEAARRGLDVECRRRDANALDAFEPAAYDLVSLQYGAIPRTPDQRGLRNLLGAVAPGGTLLVVAHDPAPMREAVDVTEQTRMYDPDAYLGVDEIAAALEGSPDWKVEVHELRSRPPGAASGHHVDDLVLRARRVGPG
ncbi:MAG TPA: FAD-dependent oxidoreductase [Acidimicrobiales bacterium]